MKCLITGIPATGKTTIGTLLAEFGFTYIDSDTYLDLACWQNIASGKFVEKNAFADSSWYRAHDWNINKQNLQNLLRVQPTNKHIAVCGIASNVTSVYDQFDKVFLLRADHTIIRKRLIDRSTNPDNASIDYIFEWAASFEDTAVSMGAVVLDASLPPEQIIRKIIAIGE